MGGLNKDKAKSQPITKQMVWEAYQQVRRNGGGAGVDQMSLKELDKDLGNHLYKLWNRLSSGSYFPPPVKRVNIPKGNGGMRPLGIPTVLDRIAQMVVKQYLEPKLEPVFVAQSYGYRPGRSAHDALEAARRNCWRYDWVLDVDIKGFFDAIEHDKLMSALKRHCTDKWVELYVKRWLKAPVQYPDGRVEQRYRGTPQGGVASPLLANLYLHYAFDQWMAQQGINLPFERYADDIIIHCRTEQEAEQLQEKLRQRFESCGLSLHPDKTKIVYCQDERRHKKTKRPRKFTFLGYDFKPRKKWNAKSKRAFTGFDLGISHKAKGKIRKFIIQYGLNSRTNMDLELLAGDLNPKIRGWLLYYGKYNKAAMKGLMEWLNYRLVRWAMKRHKRFKRGSRKATRWLQTQYRRQPKLFVHWHKGFAP